MALVSELLNDPSVLQGVVAAVLLLFLSSYLKNLAHGLPYRNVPVVGRGLWEISNKEAKNRFVNSARGLITQGFQQVRHPERKSLQS